MDCKIIKKDSFTVMGASKVFKYDRAATEVPRFWTEHYQTGKGESVCGMYGISIDESMYLDEFGNAEVDSGSAGKDFLGTVAQL